MSRKLLLGSRGHRGRGVATPGAGAGRAPRRRDRGTDPGSIYATPRRAAAHGRAERRRDEGHGRDRQGAPGRPDPHADQRQPGLDRWWTVPDTKVGNWTSKPPARSPGRSSEPGFIGGTAIVTGESEAGQSTPPTCSATWPRTWWSVRRPPGDRRDRVNRSTVNNMRAARRPADAGGPRRSTASASDRPDAITLARWSLPRATSPGQKLYYHTIEADGAPWQPHHHRGQHPARVLPDPRRRARRARGPRRRRQPGQRHGADPHPRPDPGQPEPLHHHRARHRDAGQHGHPAAGTVPGQLPDPDHPGRRLPDAGPRRHPRR